MLLSQIGNGLASGGLKTFNLLQVLQSYIFNDFLILFFEQFQVFIDFQHCLAIISALLNQNHLLLQIVLHELVLNRTFLALKFCLTAGRHPRELQLEVDEMSEFIELADVHRLNVFIIVTFV